MSDKPSRSSMILRVRGALLDFAREYVAMGKAVLENRMPMEEFLRREAILEDMRRVHLHMLEELEANP